MTIVLKPENVAQLVFFIRGEKVLLDADLAMLYDVEPRVLNQAVARNRNRFPADFVFQLSAREYDALTSQIVISDKDDARAASVLRSQIVISNMRRGGRRYPPYVFTELGVAMLSSVLHSSRAIQVNIEIMRAFVRLRGMLASNEALERKVDALEKKYASQFKVVFDAIRRLMASPTAGGHPIGFRPRIGETTKAARRSRTTRALKRRFDPDAQRTVTP